MKTLIIDKGFFFQRVALMNKNILEYIDYKLDENLSIGDIYLAKVKTINQSNDSAFLEITDGAEVYLSEGAISLKQGELILVEVIKDEFGGKLPSVTLDLSIAGKNLVFLPKGKGVRYSRKLENVENIQSVARDLEKMLLNGGVIIRSGADFQNVRSILSELEELTSQYKEYENFAKISMKPRLIKKEIESYEELLRGKRETYEIIVNNKDVYKFLKQSDYLVEKDQLILKETSLFSIYGISEDDILGRKYQVNGCELVVEKTEAMTVIDVNSKGRALNFNREQNILEINLSLCKKIVQLIIMKNISGIIIVDFISMKELSNKQRLVTRLKTEFRTDRNSVKIMEITTLGLVQIVRQRQGKSIEEKLTKVCRGCDGTGYEANEILKKIRLEETIQLIGYEQAMGSVNGFDEFLDEEAKELLEKNYKILV